MPFTGTSTTYLQTVGIMLDFEAAIHMLDPSDTPLLGGADVDGITVLKLEPVFEKKVSWQDEESLNPKTTLAANVLIGDPSVTVATGDGSNFQVDDLIKIEAEALLITAIAGDVLTVDRGWGATAAAAHTSGDDVVGIGSAPVEGADTGAARNTTRTERFNYTETFGPYKVQVSGSDMAVRKYGIATNEFDHQAAGRLRELAVAIEQTAIYGEREEDTGNSRRSAGGLDFYITTNVDSSSTSLTETLLLDQLQAIYDVGGNPDRILAGSKQRRVISSFDSAGTIEVRREDLVAGRRVNVYISDFGTQTVVLDRWVRPKDLFIIERDLVSIGTLRPTHFEPLAKTGDAEVGHILCEKTFRVRNERHMGKFNNLTA